MPTTKQCGGFHCAVLSPAASPGAASGMGSITWYGMCNGRAPMTRSPPTIVIVDDDHDTVTFLCDFFAMLDMQVVAVNPNTLTPAVIADHQPTVIILDLRLGYMTGVDVLHQLRVDPATTLVPVVFFTGSDDVLLQLLPDYAVYNASLVIKPNIQQLMIHVQDLVQHIPS